VRLAAAMPAAGDFKANPAGKVLARGANRYHIAGQVNPKVPRGYAVAFRITNRTSAMSPMKDRPFFRQKGRARSRWPGLSSSVRSLSDGHRRAIIKPYGATLTTAETRARTPTGHVHVRRDEPDVPYAMRQGEQWPVLRRTQQDTGYPDEQMLLTRMGNESAIHLRGAHENLGKTGDTICPDCRSCRHGHNKLPHPTSRWRTGSTAQHRPCEKPRR